MTPMADGAQIKCNNIEQSLLRSFGIRNAGKEGEVKSVSW